MTFNYTPSGNYAVKFTSIKGGKEYVNEYPTKEEAIMATERLSHMATTVKNPEFLTQSQLDDFLNQANKIK